MTALGKYIVECRDSGTFELDNPGRVGVISKTKFEGKKAKVLKTLDSRCSLLFSGAFFTSVRLDTLRSLQTSKKDFAWSVVSQVIYYLLVCYYAFMQVN